MFTFLMGAARKQKYELTVYTLGLVFILGLFGHLKAEVLAGLISTIFITAIGGNVGSKMAGVLTGLFGKKDETANTTT